MVSGSLLVAREDDRDDCEIDDDDDDKRVYTYALYKDNTCYVESSYPCSRFVRDGNNNDDDYSRTCTTAEAADYNTKFAAAVQELRTQGTYCALHSWTCFCFQNINGDGSKVIE